LEAYSRVLANLAFGILSRIGDVLQEDSSSNPNSPMVAEYSPGMNLSQTWVVNSSIKQSLLDKMNKADGQYCDSSSYNASDLEHSSIHSKSLSMTATTNQSGGWSMSKEVCSSLSPRNSP